MLRTTIKRTILTLSTLTCLAAPLQAKTVAIVQIIEHPALDATRAGITDTLKKNDPNLKVIWESAQGNPSLATSISQSFVGQKVDVIVAIGTTPAQAAVSAAKDQKIPVVFASVTDPKSAKLEGKSVGVSNFVDVDKQLDAIMKATPTLKRLGIIYNPGEAFSEKLIELTKDFCKKRGIEMVEAVASKTSDVSAAAQSLIGKVDGIFVNNDNTALAAFASIVKVCDQNKIPAFASDTDLIDQGALVVLGPDQYKVGVQAANIVEKILKNPDIIGDMKIVYPEAVELYVNTDKAAQLGITLDETLVKSAKPVKEKQ